MEEFKRIRPRETEEALRSQHQVDLIIDGESVGYATFAYSSKPFPLYYIDVVGVGNEDNTENQGKGYGSKIMEYLENMLDESGKAGVLIDGIDDDSPAKGMYQRRGWVPVSGTPLVAYNIPASASVDRLKEYQPRTENGTRMSRLWNSYYRDKSENHSE